MNEQALQNMMYDIASSGCDVIRCVLARMKSGRLRNELSERLKSCSEESRRLRSALKSSRRTLGAMPFLPRMFGRMVITLGLMRDPREKHIARIMMRGASKGIRKLRRALKKAKRASSSAVCQARDMLEREEHYLDSLKKYL
ncbi:MAG: hypothetical protein II773_12920 [Oscillospiraceae bacterium]|nr:hypothetical protein [Oscillospiraceae bacterium]MBQ4312481.1 hypothetical protein [Oscillospiraceae bacterium]